ncbi:MAG: prohibitin family protein [Saprospiraceae bacterium]
MALFIFGIIILFVAFFFLGNNMDPRFQKIGKSARTVGIVLLIIAFFTSCFKQVEAGYVGVLTLFGKVENEVLYPGLHLVNPLVEMLNIESRTMNYTMSGVHDEGIVKGDDAIRALTRDGLEVIMDITILYHINSSLAAKLVNEVGIDYQEKIVRPIARSRIRDFAVYYEAVDLFSKKREEFQANIAKSMEADFTLRGLSLEQILIRNITLPENVKISIEEKIKAEQESQKMQFVLQKEKQEAERKRIEAQGIADYQKIVNTGLTDKQLEYERIKALKELSLSQNAKVVITSGKGTPILINGN